MPGDVPQHFDDECSRELHGVLHTGARMTWGDVSADRIEARRHRGRAPQPVDRAAAAAASVHTIPTQPTAAGT
jgi:hypothetical protein